MKTVGFVAVCAVWLGCGVDDGGGVASVVGDAGEDSGADAGDAGSPDSGPDVVCRAHALPVAGDAGADAGEPDPLVVAALCLALGEPASEHGCELDAERERVTCYSLAGALIVDVGGDTATARYPSAPQPHATIAVADLSAEWTDGRRGACTVAGDEITLCASASR